MVWTIFENLVQKHLNIEKIIFNVVQMKFLAMHITNQKILFLYIYGRKCARYFKIYKIALEMI